MGRRRRTVSVLLAAITGAGSLVLTAAQPGSAAAFCSPPPGFSGTTATWTGGAGGSHAQDWSAAGNWSTDAVPDADQAPATYQSQYVCIGAVDGHPATVTIGGTEAYHVAGIDVGEGAQLTVRPGGRLFLGAADAAEVVGSSVERHSTLWLDGGVLGGNSPVTVGGVLRWTGATKGNHKFVATQTSSECAFDPSIQQCPGDTMPGGGLTTVTAKGALLVDGTSFGGAELGDARTIDNAGLLRLTGASYIAMDDGTRLIDRAGSRLELRSSGGVYQGATQSGVGAPTVSQSGAVLRKGTGHSIVGVPVRLHAPGSRQVRVARGELDLDVPRVAPTARLARGTWYGIGACQPKPLRLCHLPTPTRAAPQAATFGASTLAPKTSRVAVRLISHPTSLHGQRVVGRTVVVTAPNERTTHASHVTLGFDASLPGVGGSHPAVYRNGHLITYCAAHGITALNPSCVRTASIAHSGSGAKGDLTVVVVTIKPKAHWSVT